jgi:VanZ family protein
LLKYLGVVILKKFLSILSVIACMIVIFIFSNQNGSTSSGVSNNVYNVAKHIIILKKLLAIFPIRKVAHFTLYFILGLLTSNMVRLCFSHKFTFIITLVLNFLYACSDEIHQLFIEGRTSSFRDVLIDTSGACLALILFTLVLLWRNRKDAQVKCDSE